jgi:microcystin-dependent protein
MEYLKKKGRIIMEAFMGTILPWPINFAPVGWLFCNGQTLAINQYNALYALLGTTYGGTSTTFNLPNLNGRVPVGAYMGGVSTGATQYPLGYTGGTEMTTLTVNNLPNHTHPIAATGCPISGATATVSIPVNSTNGSTGTPNSTEVLGFANTSGKGTGLYSTSTPDTNLKPFTAPVTGSVSITGNTGAMGGSAPIDSRQPYIALNYIICYEGYFPSRP